MKFCALFQVDRQPFSGQVNKKKSSLIPFHLISGSVNVCIRHLDLSSLESVRLFVDLSLALDERVDVLVNNAAVSECPFERSHDGYELQFAVNHLGANAWQLY